MNKQNIFEGRRQIFNFLSPALEYFLSNFEKRIGSAEKIGNLRSSFESADSQCEQIFKVPPRKLAAISNKYNFSQYVSFT